MQTVLTVLDLGVPCREAGCCLTGAGILGRIAAKRKPGHEKSCPVCGKITNSTDMYGVRPPTRRISAQDESSKARELVV